MKIISIFCITRRLRIRISRVTQTHSHTQQRRGSQRRRLVRARHCWRHYVGITRPKENENVQTSLGFTTCEDFFYFYFFRILKCERCDIKNRNSSKCSRILQDKIILMIIRAYFDRWYFNRLKLR